tara:strand:+ start:1746 stop:1955 length:210 start_codon:yes stop_codon:yes gene_type:complete
MSNNCDEIVILVQDLMNNGKTLEELYFFTETLFDYVSLLYNDNESDSDDEYIEESIEVKKDSQGFLSIA